MARRIALLDEVALLANLPEARLAGGQVGTVVDLLDDRTVLVEFSGFDGIAYAIEPVPVTQLLVLHHEPEAA